MRGMRGKHRNCRRCGKPFDVDYKSGAKCYCSVECRNAAQKELQHSYYKKWYDANKEKMHKKPYEKICKFCGESFMGKYNQLYCRDCLETGGAYLRKLRDNRSTDFSLWEVKV